MFVKSIFASILLILGAKCFDESDAVVVEEYVDYTHCDSCLEVTQQLFKSMSIKQVQNQIVSIIQPKICDKLEKLMKKDCKRQVNLYVPYVLKNLGKISPSEQVCQILEFCPEYSISIEKLHLVQSMLKILGVEPNLPPVSSCSYCNLVQGEVVGMMVNEGVGGEIKSKLRGGCDSLPLMQSMKCNNFLALYVDKAVTLTQTLLQSDQICYNLNFCTHLKTATQ